VEADQPTQALIARGPINGVRSLQERLAAVGLPVTVDGVYGQETADAVMAFQEREQLMIDGVVGSETGEALGIWSG
jgi:peptidoglycan hydrolase-like protein with peptidoglycan-binding domain